MVEIVWQMEVNLSAAVCDCRLVMRKKQKSCLFHISNRQKAYY